jgi:hypothetical protein
VLKDYKIIIRNNNKKRKKINRLIMLKLKIIKINNDKWFQNINRKKKIMIIHFKNLISKSNKVKMLMLIQI